MNIHINLLKKNAMNSVIYNHFTTKTSDEMSKTFQKIRTLDNKQSKKYYTYSTVEDFYFNYKQYKPISFVMTNDNKYYSTIEQFKSEKIGVVEFELKYAKTIDSLGMNFHYAYIDCNVEHNDIATINETNINTHLLMLPELKNTETSDYRGDKELYCCIDSYCCERNKQNDLIIPK